MKISGEHKLHLSGLRFTVEYSIHGMNEKEALNLANETCVENTIEFPKELIPDGDIRNSIIGKVENYSRQSDKTFLTTISYAIETSSFDLLQLLNVMYGNISMAPGIRLEGFTLPEQLLVAFKGPRFGISGLRKKLDIFDRPLLCTALKPMGLNPKEFAQMAYELAIGGIDIIKDDHGLTNQSFCPFRERVERVVEAIEKANHETGGNSQYFPNLTAPADEIIDRSLFASQAGVGGMLVIPALIGWDSMRMLADNDELSLPIISHPSFGGATYQCKSMGISARTLYGQLPRLSGADASIFPNYIGRLSATFEDVQSVIQAITEPIGDIKTSFPTPGGGLTLDKMPEFLDVFKNDVIYLMGGGLHHGESLIETCRSFKKIVTVM